jgi:hypothetical protein
VQVVKDIAWVDGAPGPCRMGEAPAICGDATDSIRRGIPASCPFISQQDS